MGLDMFAWSVAQEDVIDDFTITKRDDSYPELCYWRKHYPLHHWMEERYRKRGGLEENFNCIPIRLYSEDLDLLQKLHDELILEEFPDKDNLERDQDFIVKARAAIAAGRTVYYDSWW